MKHSKTCKKLLSIALVALALGTACAALGAGVGGGADAKWDTVIGFIVPWISRIGGAVMLIGGIQFGLAWQGDDAEKKSGAMKVIIAGAIVTAVGASADLFLK